MSPPEGARATRLRHCQDGALTKLLEPIHVPEAVGRPAASEAPARALHAEQDLGLRVDGKEVIVHLDARPAARLGEHAACSGTACAASRPL